jgi:hypothetical protein
MSVLNEACSRESLNREYPIEVEPMNHWHRGLRQFPTAVLPSVFPNTSWGRLILTYPHPYKAVPAQPTTTTLPVTNNHDDGLRQEPN